MGLSLKMGLGMNSGLGAGAGALQKYLVTKGWTGSTDGASFDDGFYWLDSQFTTQATWFARFAASSTATRPYADVSGVLQQDLTANAPRFTYVNGIKLLMIEQAKTNKMTCQKLNPTGTTNLTKGGDAAATLSVASQSALLTAAGLQTLCSNGNMYLLDNTSGSTNATVTSSATTGSTSAHSYDVWASVAAGSATLQLSAGEGAVSLNGTISSAIRHFFSNNVTPASSSSAWQLVVPAGGKVYFICPGLYQVSSVPFYPIANATTSTASTTGENFPLPTSLAQKFVTGSGMVYVNGRLTYREPGPTLIGGNAFNSYLLSETNELYDNTNFPSSVQNLYAFGSGESGIADIYGQSGTNLLVGGNGSVTTATGSTFTGTDLVIGRAASSSTGAMMARSVVFFPTLDATKALAVAAWSPIMSVIDCWGDSLTAGAAASGPLNAYPAVLGSLYAPRLNYNNAGVGGTTSTQIKTKMLSAPSHQSICTNIWAGRNNYTDPTTVQADIAAMVAAAPNGKYLVLGVTNADVPGTEYYGQSGWTQITNLNIALAVAYGSKFFDVRGYLANGLNSDGSPNSTNAPYGTGGVTTQALIDAGITPTAQDLIDIGHNIPPSSLRGDTVHLNNTGYALVAAKVKVLLDSLGYSPY